MGFLDRLSGTSREPGSMEGDSKASSSAEGASSSSEHLVDTAPTFSTQTSNRLYDPYEGIAGSIGAKKTVFVLPEKPEFVFAEEAAPHRRSWGDNLQFYTGIGYVCGGFTGFAAGAYKSVTQPLGTEVPSSLRLTANRWLNNSGSLGRGFGNACGVLGLYFGCFESLYYYLAAGRVPDELNTVGAGFSTAALYRAPRGPRQAIVAGVVGAAAGGAMAGLRRWFPSV